MTYTLSGGSAHPFSESPWLGCPPFSLILEPHESQKREKESVREKRLKKERKIHKNMLKPRKNV